MPEKLQYYFLNDLQQVIKDCLSGNRNSQSKLYNHYSPIMMGICLRYAKSKEEAEDIMQEGFIKIFESLRQFRGEGSFEGWLKKLL